MIVPTQAQRNEIAVETLRALARVCFDEGDAGVVVGGIEIVEMYVYDTIAGLTGDDADIAAAATMREAARKSMNAKFEGQPLTVRLRSGDLGYIVDALLAAAEARRARGGGALQERIADHLDELAIQLHDNKVEAIKAMP